MLKPYFTSHVRGDYLITRERVRVFRRRELQVYFHFFDSAPNVKVDSFTNKREIIKMPVLHSENDHYVLHFNCGVD